MEPWPRSPDPLAALDAFHPPTLRTNPIYAEEDEPGTVLGTTAVEAGAGVRDGDSTSPKPTPSASPQSARGAEPGQATPPSTSSGYGSDDLRGSPPPIPPPPPPPPDITIPLHQTPKQPCTKKYPDPSNLPPKTYVTPFQAALQKKKALLQSNSKIDHTGDPNPESLAIEVPQSFSVIREQLMRALSQKLDKSITSPGETKYGIQCTQQSEEEEIRLEQKNIQPEDHTYEVLDTNAVAKPAFPNDVSSKKLQQYCLSVKRSEMKTFSPHNVSKDYHPYDTLQRMSRDQAQSSLHYDDVEMNWSLREDIKSCLREGRNLGVRVEDIPRPVWPRDAVLSSLLLSAAEAAASAAAGDASLRGVRARLQAALAALPLPSYVPSWDVDLPRPSSPIALPFTGPGVRPGDVTMKAKRGDMSVLAASALFTLDAAKGEALARRLARARRRRRRWRALVALAAFFMLLGTVATVELLLSGGKRMFGATLQI